MDQKKQKKTSALHSILFVAMIMIILGGTSVYMRLTPDETYSSQERRMLSKRPKLKKRRIYNGKFQRDYEIYLSEQFPGRSKWVTLQTQLNRLLGRKDANGVYFGKDGYLLEKYQEQDFDWKKVKKDIRRVSKFLHDYPQAKVMFVPTKSYVLLDKLPPFAPQSGEEQFYQYIDQTFSDSQQISVRNELDAHAKEYIYYRTDHHWTTLGAYYAYEKWAEYMGVQAVRLEEFQLTDVTESFWGTTFAKVRTGGAADTITLFEKISGQKFNLDYNMGEFQSDSFYDLSKAKGDDPYSVFFGGNQAMVDIRTSKWKEGKGKTLFILKDSFGNCFAPFLANHYDRVIVLDLRNVNVPVRALLTSYPADDILIIYNSVQFMENKDISKFK